MTAASCVIRAWFCLYFPKVPPAPALPAARFGDAEAFEFRDRNFDKAALAYRGFAASPDAEIRAAALVRLPRVLRKQERTEEALAAYGELAALGDASVAGAPAALVGLREHIALLKANGRDTAATVEGSRLAAALLDGRFRLDRATFDFYQESLPSGHPGQRGRHQSHGVR